VSPARSHFDALSRSIVFQQLSGKAAATIHGRFAALFAKRLPTPAALLELDDAVLRAVGLSRGKMLSLQDLAKRAHGKDVDLDAVAELDDAAVIEALSRVRGIGEWTAQMFLMFRLKRPDVMPSGDLGVRKGITRAHGLKKLAAPGYLERAGKKWAPHRSLAALYAWRSLDLDGGKP
jgi:DNA-3-methyladenine glycosylase II